jgi:hypothetical protein
MTRRCLPFPLIKIFRCRRHYHNPSISYQKLSDLSNPHWASEALVPKYTFSGGNVKSWNRAKSPNQRSPLGEKFLSERAPALTRAANAILGVGGIRDSISERWTAFEVGPRGSF